MNGEDGDGLVGCGEIGWSMVICSVLWYDIIVLFDVLVLW